MKALATRDGAASLRASAGIPSSSTRRSRPRASTARAYLQAKFGDGDRIAVAHARLEALGREAGIDFRFDRIARAPNTLDAHRLIRWAEPEGLQTRTAMALFRRYFELGEDISRPGRARRRRRRGRPRRRGDRPAARRRRRPRRGARRGARPRRRWASSGVPTFIVAGRYAVSGAQPPEVWARLMDELDAAIS